MQHLTQHVSRKYSPRDAARTPQRNTTLRFISLAVATRPKKVVAPPHCTKRKASKDVEQNTKHSPSNSATGIWGYSKKARSSALGSIKRVSNVLTTLKPYNLQFAWLGLKLLQERGVDVRCRYVELQFFYSDWRIEICLLPMRNRYEDIPGTVQHCPLHFHTAESKEKYMFNNLVPRIMWCTGTSIVSNAAPVGAPSSSSNRATGSVVRS